MDCQFCAPDEPCAAHVGVPINESLADLSPRELDGTVSRETPEDHTVPGDKWEFGPDVTAVFDNMLARSIPDHAGMRELVADVAGKYLPAEAGSVLDLGCSRGEAIAELLRRHGTRHIFTGLEVSEPMLDAARQRFIDCPNVHVREHDLRSTEELGSHDVVLSVLTLQFTPIEHRAAILQRAYDALEPGGALLLVEKVLGSDGRLDAMLVDAYCDVKRRNGYSEEEIARKRLSLEGVLVPVTARWNEDLLRSTGFARVECFWRHLNFAGWVAVR